MRGQTPPQGAADGVSRLAVKRVVAMVVAVALLAGVVGGVASLATIWSESLAGARPADAFLPTDLVPVDGLDAVRWREDGVLGRPLDPATRTAIARAWVEGWIRLDTALATGDTADLRTAYAGPALDQVEQIVVDAAGHGVRQAVTGHDLEVVLFSADGSVVELRAHDVAFSRQITLPGGPESVVRSTESWAAVLRLIDGRWRTVALIRQSLAG